MKHHEINLGDLAKAFDSLAPRDEESRREIAAALGFELSEAGGEVTPDPAHAGNVSEGVRPPAPAPQRQPGTKDASSPASGAGKNAAGDSRPVESDLKLVRSARRKQPPWVSQVEAIDEDPEQNFPLRREPLIPARWARSVLTESLSTESDQAELDVERLVELLATRKPLLTLPYTKAKTLRRGVQVLLDVSEAMEPFRRDQDSLAEEVIKVVGAEIVELAWFEHCPTLGVFTGSGGGRRPYQPPRPGSTVLLLTDLGVGRPMFSTDTAGEAEWLSFARTTREAGCHAVCFVPYERSLWPRALAAELTLLCWDVQAAPATSKAAPRPPGRERPDGRQPDPRIRALARRNPDAVELAKLLSLAARIEPELLRAARLKFLPHAGACAEADLWFSALFQSKSSMALLLIPSVARELREELLADDKGMIGEFWEFLTNFREETGASHAIRLEERITYVTLLNRDGSRAEIETQLRRALKALVTGGGKRSGLARWALSAIPLLPEEARDLPAARQLLWASKLRLSARAVPLSELPADLNEVRWLLPSELSSKAVGVRLLETGLEISDEPLPGMHRINVPETNPRVLELWPDTPSEGNRRVVNWRGGASLTVELSRPSVTIGTITGQQYFLKPRQAAEPNVQSLLGVKFSQVTRRGELDLSDMGLVELPEEILNLPNLKALRLNGNALTLVPESIGRLLNLQTLDLTGNRLTGLPAEIGRLVNLQTLLLTGNQIQTLPESVGQLANLRTLDLSDNGLSELPRSLLQLGRLEALYLHGNEGIGLPLEVLGPTADEIAHTRLRPTAANDILEYYFRTRGRARRPLNEAKLIVLGRGAVGKTSLLNRLVHKTFRDEKKTEGITITEWPLKIGKKKDDVRLHVWDFGGQEIMHATHQFFLSQRGLYLLVLSGREGSEDADADYWLQLVRSFGDDSPVIIVLNKIKHHPFDVNRKALLQKYPFIREFIRTDSEDGTGIAELRRVIEREVDRLEHLRDAFPASWFAIKDKLARMKKNYLSFDEFRRVCATLGEKDPQAQESLAFYLHNLGIALNYKDDPRLKDTHVLKPQWVTSGIYKILNSMLLERQKGEIKLKDLASILDSKDYPKQMHGFLLDLMERFELCFGLEGREGDYLIPELLDRQQPPLVAEFDPVKCLNFQYHYPALPEGLLPRFVVRTYVLSDDTPRWRTGVVLKLEDNLALVSADAQDRRVFISIKGPVAGRRRLLSIIRENFERIHDSMRNLKPIEMVPLPEHPEDNVPYAELLTWEEAGMRDFKRVVSGSVVTLSVQSLLNGVETEGERARPPAEFERGRAARIFVSYSHKDERLLNELKTHLSPLRRLRLIETWDDREIRAGEDYGQRINENMERADIIILLISADFIASDYCYEKEMKRALERHENKEARVVPVIVRDARWEVIPQLSKLQAIPKNGKPVSNWPNKDTAWKDVSDRIQKMIEDMRDADPLRRRGR